MEFLTEKTVRQYQQEEHSSIIYQVRSERHRLAALRDVSILDYTSTPEKVEQLKTGLSTHFGDKKYLRCRSMGQIIELNVKNVIRNVKL